MEERELPRGTDPMVLKHVLCATDFSDPAAAALDLAVALARTSSAEVTVVHVRPPFDEGTACLPGRVGVDEQERNACMERLDRCRQHAATSGAAARCALLQGDASTEILRAVERMGVDLIVMGRRTQGGPEHRVRESVTEHVTKDASCPVLVVRPGARRERPRHLLCGLALGVTGRATLAYAVGVANALDADMLVLHVTSEGGVEGARKSVAAAVARTAARGGHVRHDVVTGVPSQAILAAARENDSDLLVVGPHAGDLVERHFLGRTTLHLLRHSECPVLVVPCPPAGCGQAPALQVEVRRPLRCGFTSDAVTRDDP